jgi:hypothetical protein
VLARAAGLAQNLHTQRKIIGGSGLNALRSARDMRHAQEVRSRHRGAANDAFDARQPGRWLPALLAMVLFAVGRSSRACRPVPEVFDLHE